ncbi:MAG TPA: inositol monophosphatase family protein [Verrucomicrobiota bacterium]|nr:inositol monophosphatase family protein [Verrucomicrobiota bacterium]
MAAARAAGERMRGALGAAPKIEAASQHDLKLALDRELQHLIAKTLDAECPGHPLLAEEEDARPPADAATRWVVDPLDGTVNFAHGIPHAAVSIAFQARRPLVPHAPPVASRRKPFDDFVTLTGVVFDPFTGELWTGELGAPSKLNGANIRVSRRSRLAECIVALGFAKDRASLETMLPTFNTLVPRVRKMRITGSAALALAYVAAGRFDAYLESGLRWWDIAAGGLIIEGAGGEFWHEPAGPDYTFAINGNNGLLRRTLERAAGIRL